MVTIYDIAKQANVSAMTVSKVINNTGRISEATRNKVKKIIEETHYVQNAMARSLVLQETKILSLLITDITNPFFTTLARGAEDTAKRFGYKLLFGNSDEDYVKEKDYVEMIVSTRVDGVLFAPAGDQSVKHLQILEKHKIPFVLLDREVPFIQADTVLGDSKEGAKQLVEYLVSLSHKRIALLNGSTDVSTARQRHLGYAEALKLNGIEPDEHLIFNLNYKSIQHKAIIDELLALSNPPTAIFAANNFLAIDAIRILRGLGLRVPEDISLVCFDDLGFASELDPFLTVAAQPAYNFGSLGMQLLIERIQGRSSTQWNKILLPSQLLIRKSAHPLL